MAVPLGGRLREHDLAAALETVEPTVVVSVAAHHGFSFSDLLATMARRAALPTVRQILVVDDLGIVGEGRANAAPARLSEPLGPEVGLLLLTSGTTGAPAR